MYEYNFQKRLNQLLSMDKVRICKLIEIIQFSVIFFCFIILFVYLINNYYYKFFDINKQIEKNDKNLEDSASKKKYKNLILLLVTLLFDTILIIILFFYIRKIVLLFPSIANLYHPKFIPFTTFNFVIKIALCYLFLGLMHEYQNKIVKLRTLLSN